MDNSKQIIALYDDYNTIIKPLIAEVEARTEQFPLPLFNEIRALHDHIARCYFKDITPEQRNIEVLIASKPKRTVTPLCIYVHPTFAQLELPVRI